MSEPLTIVNLFMTICLAIGGIAAYRQGFARASGEVQERVISALQHEIEALHSRINALEKENSRLSYIITTICSALKQRGIHITIDGDVVSIYDCTGDGRAYNTRMQCVEPLEQGDARESKPSTSQGLRASARSKQARRREVLEAEGGQQ